MKKFIVSVIAAVWFTTLAFGGQVYTETFMFKEGSKTPPIPLEKVVNPQRVGQRTSAPLRTIVQIERDHHDAQIVDASPIIKDNILVGWTVSWKKSWGTPTATGVSYSEVSDPFVLPESVTAEAAMKEMWQRMSKRIDYKSKPLALNVVNRDGVRTVRGIWYLLDEGCPIVVKANGSVTVSMLNADVERQQHFSAEVAGLPAPLPIKALGLDKPQMPTTGEGEVVVMAPFKVIAEAIALKPILSRSGVIVSMKIDNVTAGTKFAEAGFKSGTYLKSVQGIEVAGLTEEQFKAKMASITLTAGGEVEFAVTDSATVPTVPRIIKVVIPAKKPAGNKVVASSN